MELLIWLWVWDKRFFFQVAHSQTKLIGIWLLPLLISLAVTAASYNEYRSFHTQSMIVQTKNDPEVEADIARMENSI